MTRRTPLWRGKGTGRRRSTLSSRSLGATTRRSGGTGWTLKWEENDVPLPWPSAPWLLAIMSDVVMLQHRNAILAGARASGGQQPALDPDGVQGKLAAEGKRPDFRGVTGDNSPNAFPATLQRSKIKRLYNTRIGTATVTRGGVRSRKARIGAKAGVTISAAKRHDAWLAREAALGVEYFFVDGDVDRLIDAQLSAWLAQAMLGPPTREPE